MIQSICIVCPSLARQLKGKPTSDGRLNLDQPHRHCSHTLSRQNNGSLLAEFRLADTEEIKKWILSFGANAVVLEPESLREEIIEEPEKVVESVRPGW